MFYNLLYRTINYLPLYVTALFQYVDSDENVDCFVLIPCHLSDLFYFCSSSLFAELEKNVNLVIKKLFGGTKCKIGLLILWSNLVT
jgi:hypothetical protein